MKKYKFARSAEGRKRFRRVVEAGALVMMLASGATQAALHDRGGGLVYDDVLDVTWLADANYAATSGHDTDGRMTWLAATTWAANLNFYDSVRNVTLTGWRLPSASPINGMFFNYSLSNAGDTDVGYNISAHGTTYEKSTNSEIAYMYYINFGLQGFYDLNGVWQSGYGVGSSDKVDIGDIKNLKASAYWTNSVYGFEANSAFLFNTALGLQRGLDKDFENYVWLVRDGDVALVPEPASAIMFCVGLTGLVLIRRRRGV